VPKFKAKKMLLINAGAIAFAFMLSISPIIELDTKTKLANELPIQHKPAAAAHKNTDT
jgi:hypothetical protein